MIPNVVKGGNMRGLIGYLVGDGRFDEHENPHVVASDGYLSHWYGTETLDKSSAGEITKYLEEPRKTYGTEIRSQVTSQDPETGEKVVMGYRDAHVWHCSLSLGPEDGVLSNEQWERIASDFMDRMEFTDAGGKSPCRWVAIHHGQSQNGNDHIHIAASMVREDGTKWGGRWRDYQAAQDAARELEVAHSLTPVDGPQQGLHERGEKPPERRRAEKAGHTTTAPKELGHRVRGAMTASTSEAEWVRRCRADGIVLKPFYAKGSTDVVTGYRAALKPEKYGDGLEFYKGGTLGKDLTLPRLRENWAEPSVEQAGEASAEWEAAFKGQPPVVRQGRDRVDFRGLAEGAQEAASRNWATYNDRLAQVPIGDSAAWSDAARDAAGVLSAWAKADPENRAELRAAASTMARSAQQNRSPRPAGQRPAASPMGTALILMSAGQRDRRKIQGALLMRQVLRTATALRDAYAAAGAARHAEQIQSNVVERLQRVQMVGYRATMPDGLSEVEQTSWKRAQDAREKADLLSGPGVRPRGQGEQSSSTDGRPAAGSPLPRPLTPQERRHMPAAGRDREDGLER